MNANENLETKRDNARAIVKLGVALMSSSLVLFFITLFHFYAILVPAYHDPSFGVTEAFFGILVPLEVETLIFVLGFLLLLLGLLVGLITRLKNRNVFDHAMLSHHRASFCESIWRRRDLNANENLETKRENTIVEFGLVLMRMSLLLFFITLFYFYAIVIFAHQDPFNRLLTIFDGYDPFFIEALIFVHGLVMVLLGLLIDQLKKRESP